MTQGAVPISLPPALTSSAVLARLRITSTATAVQVYQAAVQADIAPGAAVAVAYDGASLGKAVHYGDPPPSAVETILQASMFP